MYVDHCRMSRVWKKHGKEKFEETQRSNSPKLKANETVSWRPSVAEEVWKAAPAATCIPFHLCHQTLNSRNTISLPGDEVCIVCAKYQQLGSAKTTGDRLSREFEQIAVLLSQGVVRRSRHQLLCTAVAQAVLLQMLVPE